MEKKTLPKIIQPGMGIGVSWYKLANAASRNGCIGTVSSPGADQIVVRILQNGDLDGDIRRAAKYFPFQDISEKIFKRYFVEGGIKTGARYKGVRSISLNPAEDLIELMIFANFAIVYLAKEGHSGLVSINFLEKIQMTLIYGIVGAMLADVDFVTIGAGIPYQVPKLLDDIVKGEIVTYRVNVEGGDPYTMEFDMEKFFGKKLKLKRPGFLPIITSHILAESLLSKAENSGSTIEGFVVENQTAGGHSASPRGKLNLSPSGEPVYGPRDECDFEKMKALGIPFWIAGSQASPEALKNALALGATGIQAGSIFALCEESAMIQDEKAEIRRMGYNEVLIVKNDPKASPTGFPFKVAQLEGTMSEEENYNLRDRICNLRFLVVPFYKADGKIDYKCPAEPVSDFLNKGGRVEDTIGVKCLCNGLFAAVGLGNPLELPIFTLGKDVSFLKFLMKHENDSYSALDAIRYLSSA